MPLLITLLKSIPLHVPVSLCASSFKRGMGVSLSPGECGSPPAECLCDSPHIHMQRERVWEQLWSYMQADTGQNTC